MCWQAASSLSSAVTTNPNPRPNAGSFVHAPPQYWNFEDGPGQHSAEDVTGNGHDATWRGGRTGADKWPDSPLAGGDHAQDFRGPGDDTPAYLPIDEKHPCLPKGGYGVSYATQISFSAGQSCAAPLLIDPTLMVSTHIQRRKLCIEAMGEAFARRSKMSVAMLWPSVVTCYNRAPVGGQILVGPS